MEERLKEVVEKLYPVRPMDDQPLNETQMFMRMCDTINKQCQDAFTAGVNWHIEQLERQERVKEIYRKATANLK